MTYETKIRIAKVVMWAAAAFCAVAIAACYYVLMHQ